MNSLPDGIQQGDHARKSEADRNVQRGCILICMVFMMIFGSGLTAGWALSVILVK